MHEALGYTISHGSLGIAKIIPFDEQDVEQEDIEHGAFYYRVRPLLLLVDPPV